MAGSFIGSADGSRPTRWPAVGPPLPFGLRETVCDHVQRLAVVAIAQVTAVDFDVLGFGCRSAQAALPRDDAVGPAVDTRGGNGKRFFPGDSGCLRNNLA